MVQQSRFMLAFFAIALLAISFASASINFTQVSGLPATINNSQTYNIIFNVSTNETDLTLISFAAMPVANSYVWVKPSSILINSTNGTIQVSYSLNISSAITVPETFTFSASNGTMQNSSSFTVAIQNKPVATPVIVSDNFCKYGEVGSNLSITDFSISNNGEGEDDDWYLIDNVEIDVEVANTNDDWKISDVSVEIAIFSGSTDVTDDFDFDSEKISLGSIKADDEEVATFKITNLPADISEGNYVIKVKAYANENKECKDDSDSIQITNPFGEGVIVAGNTIFGMIEANAGESLEVSFDVINLGTNKEEEVLVTLYNKELGINSKYNLKDLRSGDSEVLSLLLDIPSGIQSKMYTVDVETFFDYDTGDALEDSSYDANSYDDLEDDYNSFSFRIKAVGENTIDLTKPIVSAKLNSSAIVGEDLVVSVTFKNNGNTSLSAILAPEEFESWAELATDPATITVGKLDSKTVSFVFKPTKAGQQTFNLNVIYNGKSMDQAVTLSIEDNTSLMSYLKEQLGSTGAYLALGIGILIALILLVIIVKLVIWLVRKH